MSAGNTTIWDQNGKIADQFVISEIDGYNVIASDGAGTETLTDTAYLVIDFLNDDMGGSGNDLLIDVESIQFQDSDVDLGLRIEIWDWDGDAGNGYDFVDVTGTACDDIRIGDPQMNKILMVILEESLVMM